MQTITEHITINGIQVGLALRSTLLTVHIHQDADVGASHSIEHLTRYWFGEEGVICCGDENPFSGSL